MRSHWQGWRRSVDRGTCGPGIEPRKKLPPGRRRCKEKRKAPSGTPISRGVPESRAVRDPVHVRRHLTREPGDPMFAGVRSVCDRPTAVAWRRETGDVQLSWLHAHLREEEEPWTVYGVAADDAQKVADEVERGESRTSATHARTHPRSRQVVASGGAWTHPLLRSAQEPTGAVSLSVPSRAPLASRAFAAQPERPRPVGPHAAPQHSLAASAFGLSPLSPAPHGRHPLRQEPDAGIPLVRIRGGGYERS